MVDARRHTSRSWLYPAGEAETQANVGSSPARAIESQSHPSLSKGILTLKAIELIETRSGCSILETTPRYVVMFRGRKFGELYFNMTGYTGSYLPCPGSNRDSPASLHVGERSISAYRKEVARLNRQWAAIDKAPT